MTMSGGGKEKPKQRAPKRPKAERLSAQVVVEAEKIEAEATKQVTVVELRGSYDPAAGQSLLDYVSSGGTLRAWCKRENYREAAVRDWTDENYCPAAAVRDDFPNLYRRAIVKQAEAWGDQIIEIVDESDDDWMTITGPGGEQRQVPNREVIDRSKLRAEARMKIMALNHPDRWSASRRDKASEGSDGSYLDFLLKIAEITKMRVAARLESQMQQDDNSDG